MTLLVELVELIDPVDSRLDSVGLRKDRCELLDGGEGGGGGGGGRSGAARTVGLLRRSAMVVMCNANSGDEGPV